MYKPIGLMIKHHVDNPDIIPQYILYAHFRSEFSSQTKWMSNSFFRKAFLRVFEDEIVSDQQLDTFREKFIFYRGLSFDNLKMSVCNQLSKTLGCQDSEVDLYYLNDAIARIGEIAIHKSVEQRRITKAEFLAAIDNKVELFDLWLCALNGKREYIKKIRRRLKAANALGNIKRRFLFISRKMVESYASDMNIHTFLFNLVDKYSVTDKLYNSTLWTVIIDVDHSMMIDIKAELIRNNIYFTDGYETVLFCQKYFDDMPVKVKRRYSDAISRVSHSLRLISASTFCEKYKCSEYIDGNPHVFIDTRGNNDDVDIISKNSTSIFKMPGLTNLSELNEVIVGNCGE